MPAVPAGLPICSMPHFLCPTICLEQALFEEFEIVPPPFCPCVVVTSPGGVVRIKNEHSKTVDGRLLLTNEHSDDCCDPLLNYTGVIDIPCLPFDVVVHAGSRAIPGFDLNAYLDGAGCELIISYAVKFPISGFTGPTGPSGHSGRDGRDGHSGHDGRDGLDGKDGKDGIDGRDGIDGIDGKDGVSGPKGDTGTSGPTGPKGDTGTPITGTTDDVVLFGPPTNDDGYCISVTRWKLHFVHGALQSMEDNGLETLVCYKNCDAP